jgi:hypothetical protein
MVQSEEKFSNRKIRDVEEISYVAWGVSKDNKRQWLCGMSKNSVTDKGAVFSLKNSVYTKTQPSVFAAMQTTDGGNTAGLRYKDLKTNSVHIRIEEEQSKDKETQHTTEVVGYLAIWDKRVEKKDLLEDDPDYKTERAHYIQPFPLFDAVIYAKTVRFNKNAIKYENQLVQALNDKTSAK